MVDPPARARRHVRGTGDVVVGALGVSAGQPALIAPACVPTAIAAAVLARWTRQRPPVPLALARA